MGERGAQAPELTSNQVIDIFRQVGGYLDNDHFVYTSGRHGEIYFNKDAIYPHTSQTSRICQEIARRYKDTDVEVVVAPAYGGIALTQWTADHLTQMTGREVLAVYTEKTPDNNQIFTRGYDKLVKGKKILIIEDVVTTGGSVVKVRRSAEEAGAEVIGICSIVNRDPESVDSDTVGAPFDYLVGVNAVSFIEGECELCKEGRPINTEVGKGKQFLARKSQ